MGRVGVPLWPVVVQAWEWECCGEPLAVGDEVAWTLLLREPGDEALPFAEVVPDALTPDEHDGPGHVLRLGALTAWAPGEDVPPRDVPELPARFADPTVDGVAGSVVLVDLEVP